MDQFHEKSPPKQTKVYLWDKPSVYKLLSLISFVPGTAEYTGLYICDQQPNDSQCILQSPGTGISNASERDISLQCGVCGVVLDGRAQLVQHHATAFHQFNQSRVLRGLQSLSLEQFQQKNAGNTDESSLSPSEAEDSNSDSYDSDEEDENEHDDSQRSPSPPCHRAGRKPRVYFLNKSTGLVVSVYRALLLQKKMVPESAESLLTAAERLPDSLKWSFLMESGGHFAGAVFAGDRAVVHKTFHSYTVRAGQGGSQGAYDSRSGGSHARSAGASLRRYNETKHAEHIHDILESWREHLQESDLIFIRSSRSISGVLFGSGRSPVLNSRDPRLRTVPFPTRKPTFAEIKRVHRLLAELKLHGSQEEFLAELNAEALLDTRLCPTNKTKERSRHSTRSVPETSSSSSSNCSSPCRDASPHTSTERDGEAAVERSPDESQVGADHDPAADSSGRPNKKKKRKNWKFQKEGGNKSDKLSPQDIQKAYEELQLEKSLECIKDALYTFCHCGYLKHLQSLHRHCSGETRDPEGLSSPVRDCIDRHRGQFSLLQLRMGNLKKTALHVASEKGHKDVVRWLLETGECDPSFGDSRSRVAYTYCPSKALKKVYREFRAAHPDVYDYAKSLIPAPLNEEQECAISEEKKKQRAAKKLRLRAYSAKKEQLLKEQKERERFLNLSDREKRALAAERRLLALTPPVEEKPVLQRCFQCANDISGLVPFEYSDNKFCSTTCVKLHRNDSKGRSDGNRVGGAL